MKKENSKKTIDSTEENKPKTIIKLTSDSNKTSPTINQTFYPVVPLKEFSIFPGTTIPLFIGRKETLSAVEESLAQNRKLVVVSQKKSTFDKVIAEKDIFKVGCLGNILQIMRLPNSNIKILFEAKKRVELENFILKNGFYQSTIKILEPVDNKSKETTDLVNTVFEIVLKQIEKKQKNKEIIGMLKKLKSSPSHFCDFLISVMGTSFKNRQQLLEQLDSQKRLELIFIHLIEEQENRKINEKIHDRLKKQISKTHKEYYLNEQIKVIQKELGADENPLVLEYEEKIKKADLNKVATKVIRKELKKLNSLPSTSSETNIICNYIDWILQVPWSNRSKENYSLSNATKILDKHHYGLEKVKERIIEFIAVTKMVGKIKGPIICLVGPPGVGKSTLAKSIAETLNRKFVKLSLGGINDEAEIRGHRRTYIGAMPGKIINSMKKSKTINPLILLDEVDKISYSHLGDPTAALLEVLDQEQNTNFLDHYLDIEYDLSQVLFLCTANDITKIPYTLQDRMEIIQLSGYTEIEKLHIFKKHLATKQIAENGLNKKQVTFNSEAILEVIRRYTKEAGIRELERCVGKICRKIVSQIIKEKDNSLSVFVNKKKVQNLLGVPKYHFGNKKSKNIIGVATGLAWTSYGGDILDIEVSCMKGKGNINLTGKLGEVMQESAKASLSFVKTNSNYLGIYSDIFQGLDIHIHLPEGSIPKDGPSAGITLTTALVSNLTAIPVKHDIAMTGEISLHGKVLEIGGLKQKLLAAKRSGIFNIIIPEDNKKNLEEMSKDILEKLTIYPISNIWNVLELALERMPQPVNDQDIAKDDWQKEIYNVLKKSSISSILYEKDPDSN